ncbi:MAG TPA: DNA N-6-adenine-methyltransferase, partial [Polyangiaceae bacterium]
GPDSAVTAHQDSLTADWDIPGNLWLNPPFANIEPWAKKCAEHRSRVGWILLLVPASVDAAWYSECVHGQAFVMPLNPRLTFAGADDPYPRGLVLAAYGFNVCGFEPWRWK